MHSTTEELSLKFSCFLSCNYSDSKHLANFLIVLSKAFDLKPSREAAVGFECPENLVAHAG